MRYVVRRLRTAAAKVDFTMCRVFPLVAQQRDSALRSGQTTTPDASRTRGGVHAATAADLPQSDWALKVLCEPHCAPSNVNAQLEECPVLLIIGHGSFGIRHWAYQGEKHQAQSTTCTLTARLNYHYSRN